MPNAFVDSNVLVYSEDLNQGQDYDGVKVIFLRVLGGFG
jgi:predicted nucleic acid-binding protein